MALDSPRVWTKLYKIDAENGNVLWNNAIAKDMNNVKVAFKVLEDGEEVPIGYDYVFCHMIFDVKTEDFYHKALLVAGGHMTETADTIT